jgi:transcriptional regulator with XRE-family HTH domain
MLAAHHLKKLRIENNYTQEYLALELEVSQKTYSNIENGTSKITLRLLQKIAKLYKINVVNLVTKLFESDPDVMENLKQNNAKTSDMDSHYSVNSILPIELLNAYKGRIEDLNKIIELKNERIDELQRKTF